MSAMVPFDHWDGEHRCDEVTYCDYCGEPTNGPEDVVACDGWTCRDDDDAGGGSS